MSGFIYEKDADGIVTVTMDMAGQPVNTMNEDFYGLLRDTVTRLEQEEGLTGVILASAKSTFFAGGDIKRMLTATPESLPQWNDEFTEMRHNLRRLEKLPVPVVAAINGAALGGGYEIASVCKHRIAVDGERVLIGLPESTLGLIPGAGGIVRTISKLGFEKAVPMILEGKVSPAAEAHELGLIEELVADQESLIPAARAWIKANPDVTAQPWDQKGFKIPGGNINTSPSVHLAVQSYPAVLTKRFGGEVPPAWQAIVCAAAETLQVNFDTALIVEGRYFLSVLTTPEAKAAMTAFVEKRK